jgi:hypothetical protein
MLPVVNYRESHFRNALVPSFNVTVTGPFILSGPSIGEVRRAVIGILLRNRLPSNRRNDLKTAQLKRCRLDPRRMEGTVMPS